MGAVIGVLLVVALAGFILWIVVAIVAAFRPGDPGLVTEASGVGLRQRVFAAHPSQVQRAYEQSLPALPGVSILRSEPGRVWADSKPTPRMLGGVYGLVLRFDFVDGATAGSPGTTQVETRAAPKLSWAPSVKSITLEPAANEVERKTRMAAKKLGISELK